VCPSPTLWWSVPHFSCCWTPSLLQAHWGRWCHIAFSSQLVYLQFMWGSAPCPGGAFHRTATVASFPHSKVAGRVLQLLPSPAGLFIYSSMRECPPPLSGAQGTRPLCYMSFFFSAVCLLFSLVFFLFSLGRGQSVQGAMLICSRVLCGSTTCCLSAHLRVCQAG
jgi:hypothetical protein